MANPIIPVRSNRSVLRLRRDANSVVIPIPRPLLRELGWKRGDFLACIVGGDILRLTRVKLEEFFKPEVK